jgi:hypothetical protein
LTGDPDGSCSNNIVLGVVKSISTICAYRTISTSHRRKRYLALDTDKDARLQPVLTVRIKIPTLAHRVVVAV